MTTTPPTPPPTPPPPPPPAQPAQPPPPAVPTAHLPPPPAPDQPPAPHRPSSRRHRLAAWYLGPAAGTAANSGGWHYRRSLASRVIWLTTIAVGLSVALVAVGAYLTARVQMTHSLDDALVDRAKAAASQRTLLDATSAGIPSWALGAADVRIAFLDSRGTSLAIDGGTAIELGRPEVAVASGAENVSIRTIVIDGARYRLVAVPTQRTGLALAIAQPLEGQDRTLSRLGWVTLAFGVVGVLIAALGGWAVASNGLRPVRRLTEDVERIARTEDFTPLPLDGDDEVARLAAAFNQLLRALDASRTRQRQLVADAGHELRTPLTALRTNIDLLAMSSRSNGAMTLPPEARDELLDDVRAQIDELTTLIGDLTQLARDEPVPVTVAPVDLAEVVDHAVTRVRRRAPSLTFEVFTRPWWVVGQDQELERAVTNLLDNAAKWSPEGGRVTVRLSDGVLTVDDQGPGIAEGDRESVFDRFWRAPDSRTMPGSGLGLSIVRQVAERHSGSVEATEAAGGGARLVLRLPGRERTEVSADA